MQYKGFRKIEDRRRRLKKQIKRRQEEIRELEGALEELEDVHRAQMKIVNIKEWKERVQACRIFARS